MEAFVLFCILTFIHFKYYDISIILNVSFIYLSFEPNLKINKNICLTIKIRNEPLTNLIGGTNMLVLGTPHYTIITMNLQICILM